MLSDKEFREIAEKHWEYTEDVITLALGFADTELDTDKMLDLCHKLYVEAMVHGWKHRGEMVKTST